jgi:broad specificity phosphatase PhoE
MITKKIPFYFIRHGQTDWNAEGVCMGSKDIPLNEIGRCQAQEAVFLLQNEGIVHIVASPLVRAKETAEILAASLGVSLSLDDDLKECTWGVLEGKPMDSDVLLGSWLKGETPEGAESAASFGTRVLRGLNRALEKAGPVLIVSHGGVGMAVKRFMGGPLEKLANAAPYICVPPAQDDHPWSVSLLEA